MIKIYKVFFIYFIFVVSIILLVSAESVYSADCSVASGGKIGNDSFHGNAKTKHDGTVDGSWTHITANNDEISGDVTEINCHDNVLYLGGPATWNNEEGFFFQVGVQDNGKTGDSYSIKVTDVNTDVIYSVHDTVNGNIQIH